MKREQLSGAKKQYAAPRVYSYSSEELQSSLGPAHASYGNPP
jgi:hypothetical protein